MEKVEELKAKAWQALRDVEGAYAQLAGSELFKAHQAAQKAFEQVKVELQKAEQLVGNPA